MDALIELLPLLAVGAYYLLRGRQRAKAKQPPPEMQEAARRRGERAPTPFQSFMQQMEEALAEASGEPATPPVADRKPIQVEVEKTTPASPLPATPLGPAPPTPEFRAAPGSFSSTSPIDHERHGFGAENPLSEESFERRRTPPSDAVRRRYDPHNLKKPRPSGRERTSWRARLRDPQAARDAFVLQTLFGARGGRHPAPDPLNKR